MDRTMTTCDDDTLQTHAPINCCSCTTSKRPAQSPDFCSPVIISNVFSRTGLGLRISGKDENGIKQANPFVVAFARSTTNSSRIDPHSIPIELRTLFLVPSTKREFSIFLEFVLCLPVGEEKGMMGQIWRTSVFNFDFSLSCNFSLLP